MELATLDLVPYLDLDYIDDLILVDNETCHFLEDLYHMYIKQVEFCLEQILSSRYGDNFSTTRKYANDLQRHLLSN